MRVDRLITTLERLAQQRGLSKRELAELAQVHPNSLRNFRTFSPTGRKRSQPPLWSPTMAILRKVEKALSPPEDPTEGRSVTDTVGSISHGNGEG
jgi:hypothetical protein